MGFYDKFVTFEKVVNNQSYALCPMHADKNASFTVNLDTDEWYCHGCGCGGKYTEFIMRYYDVGRDVAVNAVKQFEQRKTLPFPTEEYVEACIRQLETRPTEINALRDFGITDEVIKRFRLGWDDTRITIPVYSKTNKLINVRKYLPPHRRIDGSNNAKCIGCRNCNEPRFYPYENLSIEKDTVYVVEGEKDCLVAISQGLNCVTGTGGSTMPAHEEMLFKDKMVYLMIDNDPAGARLTKKYLEALNGIAKEINVIKLPCKDFTDYWATYHNTNFEDYTMAMQVESGIKESSEDSTSLSKSEYVENLNTWITLENMCVIGVDPKTYTVPKSLKLRCTNHACTKPCRIGTATVAQEVEVEPRQILQFVDSSDAAQDNFLKKLAACKSVAADPGLYVNVQKIIFQETASFMDGLEDASFEPRYGIYLYEESRLIPTVKYNFQACRVTDPRSQQNYYVIKQADAVQNSSSICSQDSINYFKTTSQRFNNINDLMQFHYDKWLPALGIEGRVDLFTALMLVYSSVTEIPWKNGIIKGWLDCMIIGDTRTGKSQMAQRIVKRLKMGSYINGENARRTGVIGGVQRSGDSWIITWGAIPMNDKGLLVIDEASGLEIEDIKELSATRSSGAVTINKIAKGEARARTRLVWLSNPRSGKNIEDFYWKGYGAFMEYIPVVEDQARYDLVLSAAREDVKELKGIGQDTLIEQVYKDIFSFAWNVSSDDIIISKETATKVEEIVKELTNDFEGGPLVVGVAVHEKLLRISCATAVMCGSISNNRLIVQPIHIEWARDFLVSTLCKNTFDYKSYIDENKKALKQKQENTKFVRGLVAQYPAIKVLLSAQRFKGSQVQEILGVERSEASKILSELLVRGLMRIAYNGTYQSDKLLIDITRQMEV